MAQPTLPSSEAEPWWRIGIAPDDARQPADNVKRGPGYARFIIEYDDQGCSYRRGQMDALIGELDSLAGQRPLSWCRAWLETQRPRSRPEPGRL